MTNLTVPTVHMNGTSKKELLAGYVKAYNALSDAIMATRQTYPNGRDYYVRPGSLSDAQDQHAERLNRLDAVQAELLAIWEAIHNQGDRT